MNPALETQTRIRTAIAILSGRNLFGAARHFRHLGGTWKRPEADAWTYDEAEWHARLYGITGYGLTCQAAIDDWAKRAGLMFRKSYSLKAETCPRDPLPGAAPPPAFLTTRGTAYA